MPLPTLAVWLLTTAIWSTVWLFIKLGVRDTPPATFAALRIALALAVLLPIVLVQRLPLPPRRERLLIASTGVVLLAVNYVFLNWGIQFVTSGLTAVLQAMTPVFGCVFAHYLLRDEKMTRVKAAALVLGVVGVAVVFSDQLDIGGVRALKGSLSVLCSAACVAIAYVYMRRHGSDLHPSTITAGQMLAAFFPLLLYASLVEGNPLQVRWTRTTIVSALYLAVLGSVVAAWLNYWLLTRIGATKLLSMGLIEPLAAVVLGAIVLGEKMGGQTLVGGICIMISVALVLDIFPVRGASPAPRADDARGVRSR